MFDHPIDTKVLALDLVGTLFDRDRGLAGALAREAGIEGLPAVGLLAARAEAEDEIRVELEEFRPYREILAESLLRAGRETGVALPPAAAARIAATIGEWPLHPDVPAALPRLASRWRLAAITDADEEDLATLLARLPAPVEHAVSAERVGCFRPEPDPLLALMHEMIVDEHEVLVVSTWPALDLEPAAALGIPAAWVDRYGVPLPDDVPVLHRAPDLGRLADRLLGGHSRRGGRRVARRPRRR